MFRSITRTLVPLTALALAACQGNLGDPWGSGPGDDDGTPAARRSAPEPLHRLNRLEYDNTVRDLLGVSITPSQDFPPDASTDGFDNIAAGLALSPSQMDLYYTAAKSLTRSALQDVPRFTQRVDARPYATTTAQPGTSFDWGWSLTRQGAKSLELGSMTLPQDEAVTISVLAGGDHSPTIAVPEMTLAIDGVGAQAWTVTSSPTAPSLYTFQTTLPAGSHTFTVVFTNGYDQPAENVYNTLVVGYVDVTSDLRVTPPGRAMVYVCDPTKSTDAPGCYRKIIGTFLERAWRRPVTAAEIAEPFDRWKTIAAAEGNDVALDLVLRGILVSSQFLYRPSFTTVDVGGGFDGSEGLVPLEDYTLANRLSYFLWSSMPDDALFEAAKKGELQTDEGLVAQVERMLKDPKAKALEKGFAAQWLDTRRLARATPNPDVYPEFDEELRSAMVAEAELFFAEFVKNDQPMAQMLTPDFGFLNDRLAQHYGLPLPGSDTPVRVSLGATQRRGLLNQGAWLTATSASTRTSPVNRGRWILEQLLCNPVPPPPPDVPAFKEPEPGASVRETLRQHREDPACASCHNLLDPTGLGMEELDGIGKKRDMEGGKPIDSSGALPPTNTPFVGASALATLLVEDRRFPECVTEKLMTYALGRSLEGDDAVFLSDIAEALPLEGDSLHAAIRLIVLSPTFRMRDTTEAK